MEGITYREGHWHPNYDHKPEACWKRVNDRLRDMDYAVSRCKRRNVVVQAGGHLGYWPMRLAMMFKKVYTFEPEPLLLECMKRNIGPKENVIISGEALGATVGSGKLLPHVSAGSWRIDPEGTFDVPMTTIDHLDLKACDAIILDIEGYEIEALKGAKDTIHKFYPVIHVEELPRIKINLRTYLANIGYKPVRQIHADCVYVRS